MKVLYFAWLRERVGASAEDLAPPAAVATAADLVGWLKSRDARYEAAFADLSAVRVAIDQVQAEFGDSVAGAREVAFFPPVTGG